MRKGKVAGSRCGSVRCGAVTCRDLCMENMMHVKELDLVLRLSNSCKMQ